MSRLAALTVACALTLGAAAPAMAVPADPAPLLLRLPDLGPGYVVDELTLSAVHRACLQLRLPRRGLGYVVGSLSRLPHRGCRLSFERAWKTPGARTGPGTASSLAVTFDDSAGPQAALARPREIAALAALLAPGEHQLRRMEPAPDIGDEAALLRFATTTRNGRPFTLAAVVWRSGPVLGAVTTASFRAGNADVQAALRLAATQQTRIAAPTPLRPPVNDDTLVLLDDPQLGVPVMWLGERLPAQGRFPALRLRDTNRTWDLTRAAQPVVRLIYSSRRLPETARIELWKPRDARRLLRVPLKGYQCERRFDGDLDGVRSTIVVTYVRERGRCPRGWGFMQAFAFFGDVTVTIETIGCCRSAVPPYDSLAGLRALLHALRPRH